MKEEVIVSAVQMPIKLLDVEKNINYIINSIVKAKSEYNADLVVFPELSDIGYIKEKDKKFARQYVKLAKKIPGPYTDELSKQAKKYGIYLVIGLAEKHPEIPGMLYNSAVLISPNGELIGKYRKVHIPEEEKHYFMPGNLFEIYNTDIGNIGIAICYDGYMPEYPRILAIKGVEILCICWNIASANLINPPELLEYMTATRAAENRIFVVSSNCIGVQGKINFFGHSLIADPVGNIISKAGTKETIISAVLKEEILLEERAQLPIFRDRRPEIYSYLVKSL